MTLVCSMLFVKHFARMREFYGNLLQAQPINTEWRDRWAFFEAGGAGLALHAIPEEYAEKVELSIPAPKREKSPVKLIFAVDDVRAERARLEGMGITVLPQSWQDPAESCDCVDPEGNIFQIAARGRLPQLFGRTEATRAS
jgi:catechol 2,3-dioxygenase-like lactoylglutathione lyase family enzyme